MAKLFDRKKYIVFILLLNFPFVTFAQQQKLAFSFHNKSLRQALLEISEKANVRFIFDDELVDGKSINTKVANDSLGGVLKTILSKNNLGYKKIAFGKIVLHRAEQNIIRGYVLDGENGEALPYANILLKGTRRGTSSNTDGFFALANATAAPCTLAVTFIGYQPGEVIADVPGGTHPLKVKLRQQTISSDEIIVKADRQPEIEFADEPAHFIIHPSGGGSVPSEVQADDQKTMHFMPGVCSIYEKPQGLYVLGGTPDQNLVLFDGIPIYKPTHFYGLTSFFHPRATDSANIYIGGYPAKYDDRLSSVLEYAGKAASGKKFDFGFGVDFLQLHGFMQLPVTNKFGVYLTVRRSFINYIKSPAYNNLYGSLTDPVSGYGAPRFTFWDGTAKIDYKISKDEILSFTMLAGADYINRAGTFGAYYSKPDENKWRNSGACLRWFRNWNVNFSSTASVVYSNYTARFLVNDSFPYGYPFSVGSIHFYDKNNLSETTLKIDNSFRKWENFQINFGYELKAFNSNYKRERWYGRNPYYSKIHGNGLKDEKNAIYCTGVFRPFRRTKLAVGVRAIHFGQKAYFDPRISFSQKLYGLRLNAAWGYYHQFLQSLYNDDILKGNSPAFYWSDTPARAVHRIFEIRYQKQGFVVSAVAYAKDYKNLWLQKFQQKDFTNGSGKSQGLVLSLQKQLSFFRGFASYHWSRNRYKAFDINAGNAFSPFYDREHELKIVMQFGVGSWKLSATGIYASGKPYTPLTDYYTIDLINQDKQSYMLYGDYNSSRLSDYQRVDIRVSKKIKNVFGMNWEMGFAALNVFNHQNVRARAYKVLQEFIQNNDIPMLYTTRILFLNAELN